MRDGGKYPRGYAALFGKRKTKLAKIILKALRTSMATRSDGGVLRVALPRGGASSYVFIWTELFRFCQTDRDYFDMSPTVLASGSFGLFIRSRIQYKYI